MKDWGDDRNACIRGTLEPITDSQGQSLIYHSSSGDSGSSNAEAPQLCKNRCLPRMKFKSGWCST